LIGAAAPLARDAFAVAPGLIYVNHAAAGVLPIATRDALHAMIDDHAARGVLGTAPRELSLPPTGAASPSSWRSRRGDRVVAQHRRLRDGARPRTRSRPGDEVVTGANEFGSNAYPWLALRARGVTVTLIDAPRERMTPDVLRRYLSPRTKVVASPG